MTCTETLRLIRLQLKGLCLSLVYAVVKKKKKSLMGKYSKTLDGTGQRKHLVEKRAKKHTANFKTCLNTFLGPLKIFFSPLPTSLDLSLGFPERAFWPSVPPGLESSEKSKASAG